MRLGEISFEVCPCFIHGLGLLPQTTIIRKDTSSKYQLVGNGQDFIGITRGGGCSSVFLYVFDIFEYIFDQKIDVVRRFHDGIIFGQIGCSDVSVGRYR